MKRGRLGGLGEAERPVLSTQLADAMNVATRAAQVEAAVRCGTRVLWGGGALVGTSAWLLDASASTVCVGVVSVLLTAVCVGWTSAWKERSGATDRRGLALLAARRLEKKFPEQSGVIVAAVDFCEEERSGTRGVGRATSRALRDATVAAATRRWSEIASQFDEAERNAVLTDWPVERFRKIAKKRLACALGILANGAIWAVWGNAAIWEMCREGAPPVVSSNGKAGDAPWENNAQVEENKQKKENDGNKGDKEKGGKGEIKAVAENGRVGGAAPLIETEATTAEEISLAALELWISELAQNAEIAEFLQSELARCAAELSNGDKEEGKREKEGKGNEKEEENGENGAGTSRGSDDATQLLLPARELKANLTRPTTGLVAQTARLNELARRELPGIEARWAKLAKREGKSEATTRGAESGGDESGTQEKDAGAGKGNAEEAEKDAVIRTDVLSIAGKEVAIYLAASRWRTLETELTASGGIGDVASLGLSRVLRCDSPEERRKILTEAAARVGEWGAVLRREEAAARIFCESWRFDAASQRWAALARRASKENRTMLSSFAGRSSWPGVAKENDKALNEAKRRFKTLWDEAQVVENEAIASVERLRERLQSERSRFFVAAAEKNGVAGGAWVWSVEADAAAFEFLRYATSQIAARNDEIARNVENNRFGVAAEHLETMSAAFGDVASSLIDRKRETAETVGAVEKTETAGEEEEKGEPRRFSALAALLTFGVDERYWRENGLQVVGFKDVTSGKGGGVARGDVGAETNETSKTADETAKGKDSNAEFDAASSNEARNENGISSEENLTKIFGVSDENIRDREKTEESGTTKTTDGATGGEARSEESANPDGRAGNQETANPSGGAGSGRGKSDGEKTEPVAGKAFSGELPAEARRRFEGTSAPEILPEYEEKIRSYRRRITNGGR